MITETEPVVQAIRQGDVYTVVDKSSSLVMVGIATGYSDSNGYFEGLELHVSGYFGTLSSVTPVTRKLPDETIRVLVQYTGECKRC